MSKAAPAREHQHQPAIVHRSGGPSTTELNTCTSCGRYITQSENGDWAVISSEEATQIRLNAKRSKEPG